MLSFFVLPAPCGGGEHKVPMGKGTRNENGRSFNENGCPILTSTMSGSPILQDGRVVGAVTHVLVNDPTRGYGIPISRMLHSGDSVTREEATA